MQGVQRIVIFAYMAMGVLLAITVGKLLGAIMFWVNVQDTGILGNSLRISSLIGTAGAAALAIWAFKNPRARDFSFDVVNELKKVTWPSRRETQTATVVVIITSIIVSIILGLFDVVWSRLTGLIYS